LWAKCWQQVCDLWSTGGVSNAQEGLWYMQPQSTCAAGPTAWLELPPGTPAAGTPSCRAHAAPCARMLGQQRDGQSPHAPPRHLSPPHWRRLEESPSCRAAASRPGRQPQLTLTNRNVERRALPRRSSTPFDHVLVVRVVALPRPPVFGPFRRKNGRHQCPSGGLTVAKLVRTAIVLPTPWPPKFRGRQVGGGYSSGRHHSSIGGCGQ
jgi:hypothetical protein